MSALTAADRDDLYANELALDNLHSNWGRAALEASVEAIVARHVQAALTELDERCTRADRELTSLSLTAREHCRDDEANRLRGKRDGVRLAQSYIGEAVRALTPRSAA